MKDSKKNAERWLKEAENTFRQAKHALQNNDYNLVCFLAEQTSQKALKAVLYADGARFIIIHSIAELLKTAGAMHPSLLSLLGQGSKLDQYYLSSRYPDAVPEPAIPSELFIKEQAEEALAIAEAIIAASASSIMA